MKNQIQTEEKNITNIDLLIEKLRSKDADNIKLTRFVQVLYFAIIILFTVVYIINPDPELVMNRRMAGMFMVTGFTIFLIYINYYYRKYKKINYTDSVKNVLQSAEKRYRIWHPNMLIVLIAVVLIGVGIAISLLPKFPPTWSKPLIILSFVLIILLFFSLGFYHGYKQWKKDSRPLWIAAKKLLEELN